MYFFSLRRKAESIELAGQFTPKEAACIGDLRRQYRAYPDRYKLDINYRRLEFARWLVLHGHLHEWKDSPAGEQHQIPDLRSERDQVRCA